MRKAIVLTGLVLALASAVAETLPEAPKPQPYFANNVNRVLVSSEVTVRLLDAYTTERAIHNPCHCFVEGNKFYGWSSQPVADHVAAQYAYSVGAAVGTVLVSKLMWSYSQHHSSKAWRIASRAALLFDISYDGAAVVHNIRIVQGKKAPSLEN